MDRIEKFRIYQREKNRKATRDELTVNKPNWDYSTNPPTCTIHNEIAVWHKNKAREKGGQWACKTCARLKSRGLKRKWKTGHINPFEYNIKKHFTLAKCNSNKINRPFTITFEEVLCLWEIQNGLCNICQRPMEYIPGSNCRNPRKVTMDRIDSSGGYTPENVQLLCDQCNRAKQDLTIDELIGFAKGIIRLYS